MRSSVFFLVIWGKNKTGFHLIDTLTDVLEWINNFKIMAYVTKIDTF